jgi:hypothetical protein
MESIASYSYGLDIACARRKCHIEAVGIQGDRPTRRWPKNLLLLRCPHVLDRCDLPPTPLHGTVSAKSCTKTAGGDLTVGLSAKRKTAGRKRASAGKVKFLTVLPAADIKAIKLRAIERGRDVTASEILEEAVAAWAKLNRGAEPRPLEDVPASEKLQFLSRMDEKLIKQIKVMAIGWGVTASALVREAVATWLSSPGENHK